MLIVYRFTVPRSAPRSSSFFAFGAFCARCDLLAIAQTVEWVCAWKTLRFYVKYPAVEEQVGMVILLILFRKTRFFRTEQTTAFGVAVDLLFHFLLFHSPATSQLLVLGCVAVPPVCQPIIPCIPPPLRYEHNRRWNRRLCLCQKNHSQSRPVRGKMAARRLVDM